MALFGQPLFLDCKMRTLNCKTRNETVTAISNQKVETLYQENREISEKLIEQYEFRLNEQAEQIAFLKSMLEKK